MNINNLTQQEQIDLVSYTSPKGLTIYYGQVTNITDDSVMYSGELIQNVTSDVIDTIRTGKALYEFHKLAQAKSDAELILEQQVNEAIQAKFDQQFTDLITPFQQGYSELQAALESKLQNLNQAESNTSALSAKLFDFNTKFTKFQQDLNLPDLVSNINDSVNHMKPATQEIKEAVRTLKSMFK